MSLISWVSNPEFRLLSVLSRASFPELRVLGFVSWVRFLEFSFLSLAGWLWLAWQGKFELAWGNPNSEECNQAWFVLSNNLHHTAAYLCALTCYGHVDQSLDRAAAARWLGARQCAHEGSSKCAIWCYQRIGKAISMWFSVSWVFLRLLSWVLFPESDLRISSSEFGSLSFVSKL